VTALIELDSVVKHYGGLRPLRIHKLAVAPGEIVAIRGIDAPGAEVLVNLLTGSALPDSGEVRALGQATSAIADGAAWLSFVDRFGIVSDRAVLLEPLTVLQNLSMPFSLEIEPPSAEVGARARALGGEVGLAETTLERRVLDVSAADRARVRLGRAVALDPDVLLLEHPTAAVEPEHAATLAADVRKVAQARRLTVLAISADESFTAAVGARALVLDAATGRLDEGGRRGWFTRRRK
jgi:NitT/TauT family transport system ATP-binding protein